MDELSNERLGILGLGTIGGSLGLALGDRIPVLTWARTDEDRALAQSAGVPVAANEMHWLDALGTCTMIVLAVPLDHLTQVAGAVVRRAPAGTLILHTASLQRAEALRVDPETRERLFGSHPMAGAARGGFRSARRDLFQRARVRTEDRVPREQRQRIAMLWHMAGAAEVIWEDAERHDALMAWVSHLPQLTATALAAVLDEAGIQPIDLGPAAREMTRLAASSQTMWDPLLRSAPPDTAHAVASLASTLEAVSRALAEGHHETTARVWTQANRWRTSGEPSS